MKVENLRSVPTWYKIRWPWSSTAMPFPIYVTCPWRSLFNSGPNSKWTWMSPKPNLNGPPRVFTYPRTKYLTWPFPSILWLRSGTNMKVENLRSVPSWYKIRWPWSSTAVPFPICVTCPWRSLFNSGPNSKWTWMSPTQSTCLSHWFNNAFNKNREFGMLRTRYDSGIFGMLAQDMKGILHERKVRECLQCLTFLRFIRA